MRAVFYALALMTAPAFAAPAPLRFAVADSWSMPIIEIEHGQPTQGILYDLMTSLAHQVGSPAEFHVLARARVQSAMERGEIDVRCYAAQSWLPNQSGDYIWSIPFLTQRNLLVSKAKPPKAMTLKDLEPQRLGTVLGYSYPAIQAQFESGRFIRDEARNEQQVLQKLEVGRYAYAISSQWALDWFNQTRMPDQQLHAVTVVQEDAVGCFVRNDPALPVQRILRTLLRMKISGEIDRTIHLYTGHDDQRDALESGDTAP
ncbi:MULTISPECIES: transporter substrate-binding domain-containing protein [Pseudomonas]|uniref:substrate-binding periplasmic protein n=1 Tax=Pseudomonas TaxID=286 RepID=UPI000CD559CE|nr:MULTISPECIES: transporter substrate-binding domain-containing protein [Pseudomonas]RBH59741.1 amino acid ABC transporter substrate-binding protein [Pseudomonas sp. MWU13-2860]